MITAFELGYLLAKATPIIIGTTIGYLTIKSIKEKKDGHKSSRNIIDDKQ